MKADTTAWQTNSAKSSEITSTCRGKKKRKFLLFLKRKPKKGTSLVNEDKSSLRNFATFVDVTKTQRKRIEQLLKGYNLHRRRGALVTLNAEEIQKEMLVKQTETTRRKNFRDSLREVFSKNFATPRRKSRALTGDISFYLNESTHSVSTKPRCYTTT